MSLFERLKSAVKGNAVLKEYEIGQQIASAGPGLQWRVYQGVRKTTRKEVSVFILDKKSKEFEKIPKRNRDPLFETFKSGPVQLARLRHPRMLTVDHPLDESNDILAFATESISACLANVLGDHSNFQSAVPLEVKDIQLSPLEVKYGLLHVLEALSFLHADAKLIHGNLNPNCIFLDAVGRWKVAGFEFCYSVMDNSEVEVAGWNAKPSTLGQPLLNFIAPEYIITKLVSRCSDMFSYAMLVYVAYNGGRVLYDHRNILSQYSKNIEWVSRIPIQSLDGVPDELKETVKAMLCIEPAVRPQAHDLAKASFFTDDPQVSTLMYLDNLYEKPELEKSQFFKMLPKIVVPYSKRIMLSFVLPAIKLEFMDKRMIPFILPTVFVISENLTSQEFASHILPTLVPVFRMQDPVQIPLILLQRMELLLKKTSAAEIREHIVPLLHSSLQSSSSKVQELCIGVLPEFAEMLDFTSLNKSIVGQLLMLLNTTDSLSLRVKILVSLSKLLDVLDKEVVLHQILPSLATVDSRQPAVLMSILGVYHAVMKGKKFNVDRNYLARSVLPHLLSLSLEATLKTSQFEQFSRLIHEILTKVENEQRAYLEQLGKMQEQTISTVELAQEMKSRIGSDDASLHHNLPFDAKDILSTVKPMQPVNQTMPMETPTPSIVAGSSSSASMDRSSMQQASTEVKGLPWEQGESSPLLTRPHLNAVPVNQTQVPSVNPVLQAKTSSPQDSGRSLPVTRSTGTAPLGDMFREAETTSGPPSSYAHLSGQNSLGSSSFTTSLSNAVTFNMQSSVSQGAFQPPSTQQPMLQPTSTQQPMLQPTSTQQPMLQPTSTQQSMLQPTSTQQQMLQPTSTQQPMLQPTSTQQQMLQPTSTQSLFSGMSVSGSHPSTQPGKYSSATIMLNNSELAGNQQVLTTQNSLFNNMDIQSMPPQQTQPSFPAQQTQPSFPSQQMQPSFPSQQTQPSFPAQQTQPSFPPQQTQPSFPSQQTQPSFPSQQTQPSFSAQQTQPSFPSQQTQPSFPAQHTQPSFPAQQTQPSFPSQHTQPSFPAQQTQPSFPSQQTQPSFPAQQTQPSFPAQHTQPSFPPQQTQPSFLAQQTQPSFPMQHGVGAQSLFPTPTAVSRGYTPGFMGEPRSTSSQLQIGVSSLSKQDMDDLLS